MDKQVIESHVRIHWLWMCGDGDFGTPALRLVDVQHLSGLPDLSEQSGGVAKSRRD